MQQRRSMHVRRTGTDVTRSIVGPTDPAIDCKEVGYSTAWLEVGAAPGLPDQFEPLLSGTRDDVSWVPCNGLQFADMARPRAGPLMRQTGYI